MFSLAFDFFIFFAVAAEVVNGAGQCHQLADCLKNSNVEMQKCIKNVNQIDISKLKGGDFDQCSNSK